MNKQKVLLIGAGGHTRSLINLINTKVYDLIGIFDQNYNPNHLEIINGINTFGDLSSISNDCRYILSIGKNSLREDFYKNNFDLVLRDNLIHESSLINPFVSLGLSNQIFPTSFINSGVSIGDNNIINTGCIIEHETKIGNHNHIET